MNTMLIDSSLFVLTLLCCTAYCYYLYRQPHYHMHKAIGFLLVFLAMYPLLNMVGHLVAVSWVAVVRAKADVFTYDIKFYALLQFGILAVLLNGYLLRQVKEMCLGHWEVYRNTALACLLQVGIVLPLFPFNPLSALPPFTSLALLGIVTLVRYRRAAAARRKPEHAQRLATAA